VKVYVQLKSGEKQVYEIASDDLDATWCQAYTEIPNAQRVLIPIDNGNVLAS